MAPSSAATPTHGYEPTREAAMAIASTLAAAGYNFILLLRWRNTLSSGMLTTRFLFPKFFPKKNLAKKLGRVLQPEISGMVCARVRSCSTPPPLSCR